VSIGEADRPAAPAADASPRGSLSIGIGRRRPAPRRVDMLCVALLVVLVAGIEYAVRRAALRPLWYDELWRARYLSVPLGDYWSQLRNSNGPSALGWVVLSRGLADLLGWHVWVLRLPELVALPVLAGSTYAFARRFTGPLAALAAGASLGASGTIVDLGTQFKPYVIEAVCAIAVLALWLARPAGTGSPAGRIGYRVVAGVLTVFTVPLAFLVGPLALADVVLVKGGLRVRLRAALEAVPAVIITLAHTVFFVGRQSRQRISHYWDFQFLAGRTLAGGLRFVGHQVITLAGSAPSGVDRTDVNVVHTVTDGTAVETWVLAPAFAVAFLLGALVLLRRKDGQVVLFALVSAEVLQLAASAERYWPFGPTRTNLFLVPLLVLVPAVGISDLARRARRHLVLVPPVLALAAVTAVALGSSASSAQRLYDHQHDLRLIDQLSAAADSASTLARPGDLTVVTGNFTRPGWIYSMDVNDDRPAGLRRIPRSETVFSFFDGPTTQLAALEGGNFRPKQVLVFVLDIDRFRGPPVLARLRSAGYCPASSRHFLLTGRLTVLRACRAG